MKRKGNISVTTFSYENLFEADREARRGKRKRKDVILHDINRDENLKALNAQLLAGNFKTSPYSRFRINDPKPREIFKLPYYPDRIVQHAIVRVIDPILTPTFTADTYSCIKGRGIHKAAARLKKVLNGRGADFCLKMDIRQFYPSIDHEILKSLLRRKIKDQKILSLLDEIIDSAPGLPIGNYLSQILANFYLTGFDHWIKEHLGVKHYFRYADDIVIIAKQKSDLHAYRAAIQDFLKEKLNLDVKRNYRVFPVSNGIDFLGYVFYPTHTRLRKSIKQRFVRKVSPANSERSIPAYWGWIKHCDGFNLWNKHAINNY